MVVYPKPDDQGVCGHEERTKMLDGEAEATKWRICRLTQEAEAEVHQIKVGAGIRFDPAGV